MHFGSALMGSCVYHCILYDEGQASQKILYCSGACLTHALAVPFQPEKIFMDMNRLTLLKWPLISVL